MFNILLHEYFNLKNDLQKQAIWTLISNINNSLVKYVFLDTASVPHPLVQLNTQGHYIISFTFANVFDCIDSRAHELFLKPVLNVFDPTFCEQIRTQGFFYLN